MVRLRLTRTGRKNSPAYRISAVNRNSKRDGKSLEILGFYNPSENPVKLEINKERYEYWISVGAQPSDTVSQLFSGSYKFVPYKQPKSFAEKLVKKSADSAPEVADTATQSQ